MSFEEKLRILRKNNNLSQEELAAKLQVSRQAISKWETGTIPDIDNILKISTFLIAPQIICFPIQKLKKVLLLILVRKKKV